MDFKPLITLLAIVNPLAIVPFFIHYTQGFSKEQKRKTIKKGTMASGLTIASRVMRGLKSINDLR